MFRFNLLAGLLWLGGCVATAPDSDRNITDQMLLDPIPVFGEAIEAVPTREFLQVTPAMVEFVDQAVDGARLRMPRFNRLMASLTDGGYFTDHYDSKLTFTADETFAAKRGNCLSYTVLFVALARQAGLEARFQLVDVLSSWDVDTGMLVRNNHVNVVLPNVIVPGLSRSQVTVDFNVVEAEAEYKRWVISDAFAESLFYSNLAVNALREQDWVGAYRLLRHAVELAPDNHGAWNNLGAVYSLAGHPERAQLVYQRVLQADDRDKTALHGLANSLHQQGKAAEAQDYERQLRAYRLRNPYYLYAQAQAAYRDGAYDETLQWVDKAIALKRGQTNFYLLQAAAAEQVGDKSLADRSLRLAKRFKR